MISRRMFFPSIASALCLPWLVKKQSEAPAALRHVWVFRAGRVEKCRMIEIKKGMLFSMREPSGEHVGGAVWLRATSDPRHLPPPAVCTIDAEIYA